MKIYCEHCGTQIDTDKCLNCPSCGAPYANNEEFLKQQRLNNDLKELDVKQRRLRVEQMELDNQERRSKKKNQLGCLFMPVVAFLSLLGVVFLIVMIFVIASDEAEEASQAETSRKSISYSVSIEPINMPDIPEITNYSPKEAEIN